MTPLHTIELEKKMCRAVGRAFFLPLAATKRPKSSDSGRKQASCTYELYSLGIVQRPQRSQHLQFSSKTVATNVESLTLCGGGGGRELCCCCSRRSVRER